MRIVIAGGKNKADFLIGSLLQNKHQLVVINDDKDYCSFLAQKHNITVVNGDPCKKYVLEEANIYGYDIIIALRPVDADNLAICQSGRRLFHIKKAVSVVSNPKNVAVFKKLGVNTAISATYMICKTIEQASVIENLVNSLSIEQDNIVLTELLLNSACPVCGKRVKEIRFPEDVIISCIVRGNAMVLPHGKTELLPNDKLIILSAPERQQQVIAIITGEKDVARY